MPNRILREGILTSEAVNSLGWAEEVFYRRLISVVDDFGRYYASPKLLRAACYPLHIDKVSDDDIGKWTTACVAAGLIRVYEARGEAADRKGSPYGGKPADGSGVPPKRYLVIERFGQQVRAKDSKFPQPPSACVADAKHMLSTCTAHDEHVQASAHLDGDGDGDGDDIATDPGKPDGREVAEEAKPPPKPPPRKRPRDLVFDELALFERLPLEGLNSVEGGRIAKATKLIRQSMPEVSPEEIRRRGAAYLKAFQVQPTALGLASNWNKFANNSGLTEIDGLW